MRERKMRKETSRSEEGGDKGRVKKEARKSERVEKRRRRAKETSVK